MAMPLVCIALGVRQAPCRNNDRGDAKSPSTPTPLRKRTRVGSNPFGPRLQEDRMRAGWGSAPPTGLDPVQTALCNQDGCKLLWDCRVRDWCPWPALQLLDLVCPREAQHRGRNPPRVTFRLVVVPLRGPGQSPVLPFACCIGSLLSVGRCGRCCCWCRFRVRGAQWLVCWGCAGCGSMCRLRVSGAQ